MQGRTHKLGAGLVAIVAAVTAVLWDRPVLAVENETFGLAPFPEVVAGRDRRTFSIPLEPGATFEDAVRVYNRTDQPLDLVVYAADAEAGLDGAISVGFRGDEALGVGAWIGLDRNSLSLPPRGETVVRFQVAVESTDPAPDLGAVVVENTARGLRTDLAQRLHVVVLTAPPNTATTSERVRPLLLRSPWIIVAVLGLLLAAVLVVLGARRARRPQDTVTEPGELSTPPRHEEETPEASRPVLHRLGTAAEDEDEGEAQGDRPPLGRDLTEVIARYDRTRQELDGRRERPEPELEEEPDEPEPDRRSPVDEQPERGGTPSRPARRSSRKLDYIPLDEL